MKLTEKETGKRVVNADGETIGMVSGVDEKTGKAYVDPEPNVAERIMSRLGWEHADEDDYSIEQHHVASITGDEIKLKN